MQMALSMAVPAHMVRALIRASEFRFSRGVGTESSSWSASLRTTMRVHDDAYAYAL